MPSLKPRASARDRRAMRSAVPAVPSASSGSCGIRPPSTSIDCSTDSGLVESQAHQPFRDVDDRAPR